MSPEDFDRMRDDYSRRYPPILSAIQATEIAGVTLSTLYDWSSQGRLNHCKLKQWGKRGKLRFDRDGFVRFICGDAHDA
jgi:hypothetical protein